MKNFVNLNFGFFLSAITLTVSIQSQARQNTQEGSSNQGPVQQPSGEALDPFKCNEDSNCNRLALQAIERAGFKCLGYDGARMQIFHVIDVYQEQGNTYVDSVYSKERIRVPRKGLPDGNEFNTEHTYPQSLLKNNGRFQVSRADLYHLFPTGSKINGMRGNLPFAECTLKAEGQGQLCPGNRSFMPPKKQRGPTARAMFYMSVMYGLEIPAAEESVLRKWNQEFPPSEQELDRLKKIELIQGNTNPFISHPEYVSLIRNY